MSRYAGGLEQRRGRAEKILGSSIQKVLARDAAKTRPYRHPFEDQRISSEGGAEAMRRCKQFSVTSEALRHIFLPSCYRAPIGLTAVLPTSAVPIRLYRSTDTYISPNRRLFQPNLQLNSNSFGPKDRPGAKAGDVRDELIRALKVYLVQPDDTLGEPVLLRDALDARQVDERGRPTQYLRQVREPNDEFPYPVCKYYDKKIERDRELARKKAAKIARTENKQLEINWTVSDNDLHHRMERLKEFLGKGWKVEIILGSMRKKGWKGKRLADPEEAKNLISRIRAAAMEVEGARERAEMKGVPGQEVFLTFEGLKKKDPSAG
ncbi:MAG: hypothetical protein Q9163_002295 [Psora crenata]